MIMNVVDNIMYILRYRLSFLLSFSFSFPRHGKQNAQAHTVSSIANEFIICALIFRSSHIYITVQHKIYIHAMHSILLFVFFFLHFFLFISFSSPFFITHSSRQLGSSRNEIYRMPISYSFCWVWIDVYDMSRVYMFATGQLVIGIRHRIIVKWENKKQSKYKNV